MTLNERIKKLRKVLDLTQREFADRIGIKQNSVALIEGGRNTSDQTIISICREFNVNETWLRTGEGEMFVAQTREDEIAAAVQRLMSGESADFKRRLITALSTLKEEHWELLEQKLLEIVAERPQPQTLEQEARAEAERYYQELLEEKKAAARSSALPDTKEA